MFAQLTHVSRQCNSFLNAWNIVCIQAKQDHSISFHHSLPLTTTFLQNGRPADSADRFLGTEAYLGTFDWGLQFNQIMYIALALASWMWCLIRIEHDPSRWES